MFRCSWSQALFVGEMLDTSLERLARCGYDAVELPLTEAAGATVAARLAASGLACSSVNGSFAGAGRDLSSADPAERAAAVEYVGACLRFAAEVGAPVAIVVPTRIGKLRPEGALADEWQRVVASLAQIGDIAAEVGVTVVIECVNRAESYLSNRLDTARRLAEATGSAHVAVMADSFHMNIEEVDMVAALEGVAGRLRHVHLAANNRMAPGMGHLDLAPFLRTLRRIGYSGTLTMECDVQALDGYGRFAPTTAPDVFDTYAATAIRTLRDMEARLAEPVGL